MVKKRTRKKGRTSAENGGKSFTAENNPRGRPKTRQFREALIAWGLRPVPTDQYGQPKFMIERTSAAGKKFVVNTLFAEIKKRGERLNSFDIAAMQLWRRASGLGEIDAIKMISDLVDGTPVSTLHMGALDGTGNLVDPAESASANQAVADLLTAIAALKTEGVVYEGGMAGKGAPKPDSAGT